jgi:hypothetical protein
MNEENNSLEDFYIIPKVNNKMNEMKFVQSKESKKDQKFAFCVFLFGCFVFPLFHLVNCAYKKSPNRVSN